MASVMSRPCLSSHHCPAINSPPEPPPSIPSASSTSQTPPSSSQRAPMAQFFLIVTMAPTSVHSNSSTPVSPSQSRPHSKPLPDTIKSPAPHRPLPTSESSPRAQPSRPSTTGNVVVATKFTGSHGWVSVDEPHREGHVNGPSLAGGGLCHRRMPAHTRPWPSSVSHREVGEGGVGGEREPASLACKRPSRRARADKWRRIPMVTLSIHHKHILRQLLAVVRFNFTESVFFKSNLLFSS